MVTRVAEWDAAFATAVYQYVFLINRRVFANPFTSVQGARGTTTTLPSNKCTLPGFMCAYTSLALHKRIECSPSLCQICGLDPKHDTQSEFSLEDYIWQLLLVLQRGYRKTAFRSQDPSDFLRYICCGMQRDQYSIRGVPVLTWRQTQESAMPY